MKTLLLMRHAKSSWKHPELPDAERGLAKRGKKDAPLIGSLLKDKELVPQAILSSTAERSRQTALALAETSGYQGEVAYQDGLYLAEPEGYLAALTALPEPLERVLVIGHNPGLEGLLQLLSGRIEALPTSTIAYLSLPVQRWADHRRRGVTAFDEEHFGGRGGGHSAPAPVPSPRVPRRRESRAVGAALWLRTRVRREDGGMSLTDLMRDRLAEGGASACGACVPTSVSCMLRT